MTMIIHAGANKKGDEDGANDDDAGDEDSQSWTKEVPSSSGWPISDERNDDEGDDDDDDGDDDVGDGEDDDGDDDDGGIFNQSC